MNRSRGVSIAILALAVNSALVYGEYLQTGQTPETDWIRERWKTKVQKIEEQLTTHHYEKAAQSCSALMKEFQRQLGPGGTTAQGLALISAYRAIAETGLGNLDAGLWYWRTAQMLASAIDQTDLEAYDPIAARLKATKFRESFPDAILHPSPESKVVKPKLHKPKLEYPEGLGVMGVKGYFVVEVVVDTDGRAKEPRVTTENVEPILLYTALDAIMKYKFDSARAEDHPVPALFRIGVDFGD